MKQLINGLKVAAVALAIMTFAAPVASAGGTPLNPEFKTGLRFTSDDGDFQIKVGGRIMNDWAWLSSDDALADADTNWTSGTEFRRARLYIGGHIYRNLKFKAQYDFAGGKTKFKDVYLQLTKLPVIGSVKVGHFKEPFSLEEQTSSKYISLMERALPVEAFSPSRKTGFMIGDKFADGAGTWAVSTYRSSDGAGDDYSDNGFSYAGRLTFAPIMEKGEVIHLGVAYASESPAGDEARFRARPEMHMAPTRIVNTGHFAADSVTKLGVEAAAVFGPFSVQGEYITASASTTDGSSDPTFAGYYAYVSYFVTGESRPYKHGSFSRVKPNQNFGEGPGAIELLVRTSSLDLTDGAIAGGKVTNLTVGLNWYLNPNSRVMLNYVSSDKDTVGTATATMARFQIDF